MRVRTSADTIRNMERLLAFDEAAGSRGTWTGEDAGSRMASTREQSSVSQGGKSHGAQHSSPNHRSLISGGKTLGSSTMMDHF